MIQVNVLWIEGPLTDLARTALACYRRHGCEVVLWSYDPATLAVPMDLWPGIEVCHGNRILPREELEQYRFVQTGQWALASDVFAWHVVHERGGWFGHLDLTLLGSLADLDERPYVFGPHFRYMAGMALWKAPAGSPLTARLTSRARALTGPADWHLMMREHNAAIRDLDLESSILGNLYTDDGDLPMLHRLFTTDACLPVAWKRKRAIHWCGSGPVRGINPAIGSVFDRIAGGTP